MELLLFFFFQEAPCMSNSGFSMLGYTLSVVVLVIALGVFLHVTCCLLQSWPSCLDPFYQRWFHFHLFFSHSFTISSIWYFFLIADFLCLSYSVYPAIVFRIFISVVRKIIFVPEVSALASAPYVSTGRTHVLYIRDSQSTLRCLFL